MCATSAPLASATPAWAAEIRAQTRSAAADTDAESICSLRILSITLSSSSFSLFLFMMFLPIVTHFFSQFCSGAVKNDAHNQWRRIHRRSNLAVIEPLVITQNKHFASSLAQPPHGLSNQLLQ